MTDRLTYAMRWTQQTDRPTNNHTDMKVLIGKIHFQQSDKFFRVFAESDKMNPVVSLETIEPGTFI